MLFDKDIRFRYNNNNNNNNNNNAMLSFLESNISYFSIKLLNNDVVHSTMLKIAIYKIKIFSCINIFKKYLLSTKDNIIITPDLRIN